MNEVRTTKDDLLIKSDQSRPQFSFKNWLLIFLWIFLGTIIVAFISVLIFNSLLPRAYWQSRELESNQAKWDSQRISHYRMTFNFPFTIYDSGQMPLTVEVKDGKVISILDSQGDTIKYPDKIENINNYPYEFTIPGLFAYLHDTIWKKPPDLQITYDSVFGYPLTVDVYPYYEPCCEEFTIYVRDFNVLIP